MRVALLTISDRSAAGTAADLSGPLLRELVEGIGGTVVRTGLVSDDPSTISSWLKQVADNQEADLVLTSGGTGLAPRDKTPEATQAVLDQEAPGIAEAIRMGGLTHTPRAMLSRGVAGVRKRTLIINLSGSPKAVREQWAIVAPVLDHAVATITGGGEHRAADAARQGAS